MKKLILIGLLVLTIATFITACQPKEVEGVRHIYRVGYRRYGDGFSVTSYFWVDDWGRPVDFKDYAPSTPISDNETIQMYLASLQSGK